MEFKMDKPLAWSKSGLMTKRDAIVYLEEIFEDIEWKEHESVLDIGCGAGDLTGFILLPTLPLSASLIGCDISKEMLLHATKNYQDDRLSFRHMDLQDKNIWRNWKKESVDKIFSFYMLHWIKDKRQAAVNLYSLLKPGGEVFLQYLADHPLLYAMREVRHKTEWSPDMEVFFVFSDSNSMKQAADYPDLLKEVGFSNANIKINHTSFSFQNMDAYLGLLEILIPSHIPEKEKNFFMDSLKDAFLTKNLVKINPMNGKVKTEYHLANVYARK